MFRVDHARNLFGLDQMKTLCDMCRLDMDENSKECGRQGHRVDTSEVCQRTGHSEASAKEECAAKFDEATEPGWYNVCVLEVCASGNSVATIAKIEEHIQ